MSILSTDKDVVIQHPIFSRPPGELLQYVYKEVCITTNDGKTHTGWVYTVDPVSQSFTLAKFCETSLARLEIVMGHSVDQVIVVDDNQDTHKADLDNLFNTTTASTPALSAKEFANKRAKLKSWLLKNRLPVKDSPDNDKLLCISDALFIEPPYDVDSCRSTNEIILGRVQGLIRNMPQDDDDS